MTIAMALVREHKSFPAFMLILTALAIYILFSPSSGDDFVMNFLTAAVAATSIFLGIGRLAIGATLQVRKVWVLILILLATVCVHEFFENTAFGASPTPQFDNFGGVALLIASVLIARLLARFDPIPPIAARIFWGAFAAQCLSVSLACTDYTLVSSFKIDSELLQVLIDFSQFTAIQIYFAALVLFLATLNAERIVREAADGSLGDVLRFVFFHGDLGTRIRYPKMRKLPWSRQILHAVHFILWFPEMSPIVKRKFDKGLARQFFEIVNLTVRHGLDAQAYYLFEMYRNPQREKAGGYLMRFETKNGIFEAMNKLFPKRTEGRTDLGDKLSFAKFCEANGIRYIPVIAVAHEGELQRGPGSSLRVGDDPFDMLDGDLFVKPKIGKGAKGIGRYRCLPDGRYEDESGSVMDRPALQEALKQKSRQSDLLIQPRLHNHPGLADLAEKSLIAIRVFTCMDTSGNPMVTQAMIRILCMLEPDWSTKIELAAPIDVATGELGAMTGDKGESATVWSDTHPITGVTVRGRVVPLWPDVQSEVLKAHRACADRFVIGWDVACTPDGAVIIEANAYPDVEFPQRVHRAPISESPMGPLLRWYGAKLKISPELADMVRGVQPDIHSTYDGG